MSRSVRRFAGKLDNEQRAAWVRNERAALSDATQLRNLALRCRIAGDAEDAEALEERALEAEASAHSWRKLIQHFDNPAHNAIRRPA